MLFVLERRNKNITIIGKETWKLENKLLTERSKDLKYRGIWIQGRDEKKRKEKSRFFLKGFLARILLTPPRRKKRCNGQIYSPAREIQKWKSRICVHTADVCVVLYTAVKYIYLAHANSIIHTYIYLDVDG